MGLGIPPLKIKTMLESNPLKSIVLGRRLAVWSDWLACRARWVRPAGEKERLLSIGAKCYAPEVTKVKVRWKMPLEIRWKLPEQIHWTSDSPLENTTEKYHYVGNATEHPSEGTCH